MKESEPQARAVAYVDARPLMAAHDTGPTVLKLLAGEVAELRREIEGPPTGDTQHNLASESADILHYLLYLSHLYGFDLVEALYDKLAVNEARFPADMFQDTSLDFQTVYLQRKRDLGELP